MYDYKDKKILLIGPAPYILNDQLDCNDYDLVIKLNKMIERDIGNHFKNDRTDILYHCLSVNVNIGDFQYNVQEWKDKNVKHVRIPYPPSRMNSSFEVNINIFKQLNKNINLDYSVIDHDVYENVYNCSLKTQPNSGTIAIFDILSQDPKLLHIKGITMMDGGYAKGYRKDLDDPNSVNTYYRRSVHNIQFQKKALKELLDNHNNILLDPEVKKGIYS